MTVRHRTRRVSTKREKSQYHQNQLILRARAVCKRYYGDGCNTKIQTLHRLFEALTHNTNNFLKCKGMAWISGQQTVAKGWRTLARLGKRIRVFRRE